MLAIRSCTTQFISVAARRACIKRSSFSLCPRFPTISARCLFGRSSVSQRISARAHSVAYRQTNNLVASSNAGQNVHPPPIGRQIYTCIREALLFFLCTAFGMLLSAKFRKAYNKPPSEIQVSLAQYVPSTALYWVLGGPLSKYLSRLLSRFRFLKGAASLLQSSNARDMFRPSRRQALIALCLFIPVPFLDRQMYFLDHSDDYRRKKYTTSVMIDCSVLAPFFEEILMKALFLSRVMSVIHSPAFAVPYSAAVFAALHFVGPGLGYWKDSQAYRRVIDYEIATFAERVASTEAQLEVLRAMERGEVAAAWEKVQSCSSESALRSLYKLSPSELDRLKELASQQGTIKALQEMDFVPPAEDPHLLKSQIKLLEYELAEEKRLSVKYNRDKLLTAADKRVHSHYIQGSPSVRFTFYSLHGLYTGLLFIAARAFLPIPAAVLPCMLWHRPD
mmetsp:Transcript_14352/g.23891  ORF Transcript_14352/g.23891 Transcript_14352/m.23891 type:complete len:449 (+) Transcript_14352:30-1376(+)